MRQNICRFLEAISKILRREGGEFGKDARKPPERARRWPFRPSSTRDKADEADFPKATAATEVFLRWLLAVQLFNDRNH